MAKATSADWEKAKALFESGKSLSEINAETGIDRATVLKRAKKDGWEKGIYQQLIVDSARVKAEISTLTPTVLGGNHSHPQPHNRQLMHRKPCSSAGNHICQVTPR